MPRSTRQRAEWLASLASDDAPRDEVAALRAALERLVQQHGKGVVRELLRKEVTC